MRSLFVLPLVFAGAACGPFLESKTGSIAPADPTPLAKCRIAASTSSPLVTEWPASEKAHLESLAATHTVAVEYSGCELHIVDACTLPGNYAWQRTTLSTDTVDIANADELYAKLPIGALNLEGELQRSGHIAVRTTVSGQLRLEGMNATDTPREGPCARVTHYVAAFSVGAYKLLSGGALKVGADVAAGKISAGGQHDQRELVLREAGDVDGCGQSTDENAPPSCKSPLQIFLRPVPRELSDEEKQAAVEDKKARESGIFVNFTPPGGDDPWSLRQPNGGVLCKLPCSRWVAPGSGYSLRREEAKTSGHTELAVPASFDRPTGSTLEARVLDARGSKTLGVAGIVGFSIVTIVGAIGTGLGAGTSCIDVETHRETRSSSCSGDGQERVYNSAGAVLFPGMLIGGLLGIGGSAYYTYWSRSTSLELVTPSGGVPPPR